jgi:hypothetical protein
MRRSALSLVALVVLLLAACSSGGDDTPSPTPEATDTTDATTTASATATPEPTAEPTLTTLEPKDIFANVAPSIAFVETPLGTGSAILIQERWLVSNAHVVWPYEAVRIVFADGTEYLDAPVYAWDLMADLAVIELPASPGVAPVDLADPAELPTGSNLYLIGYPAENEEFPQPTISGGVLSRVRSWNTAGLTYIQTDAAITGGQSGGALVSDTGRVVGLSGFKFADTFGLALAAPIVDERATGLIEGTDVNSLSDRHLASSGGAAAFAASHTFTLENYYDQRAFIVDEPFGTDISVEIDSTSDAILDVYDTGGTYITSADDFESGVETLDFEIDFGVPFVVIASQYTIGSAEFSVSSSPPMALQDDPDDARQLSAGRTYVGAMDYPADYDMFYIDLDVGETVTIRVETVNFDPDIAIDDPDNTEEALGYDDNSGGGVFGTDAELTFTAPSGGRFIVSVTDVNLAEVGGYYLIVE